MPALLIKSIKSQSLILLTILLMAVIGVTVAMQATFVHKAYALTEAEINAAATEACKTSVEQPACRNGFRNGYSPTGETVDAACVNRPTYSTDQKNACKQGYGKGETLRAETNTAAAATGVSLGGGKSTGGGVCGNSKVDHENVHTKFNFGCLGPAYEIGTHGHLSPIMDAAYAIIRFLSAGVGVIVVISIILAGIKYSSSEGNPEATQEAKNRVKGTLIGLLVYIFAFALIQYLVPGGVFS